LSGLDWRILVAAAKRMPRSSRGKVKGFALPKKMPGTSPCWWMKWRT